MPKVQSSRCVRAQDSTSKRRARANRVKEQRNEITFRCKRCEEKNLCYFVDTATRRCASYISVAAACSLFVSKEEQEKVQAKKRKKQLEIARAKERQALAAAKASCAAVETSCLRRKLLETKAQEQEFANQDLAILNLQDRAKEQAEGNSAPGTGLPVVEPPLSEPSADLGWLQANSFNPSFDYSFLFPKGVPLASPSASSSIHVLVTYSSLGFLQVPKCYSSPAILAT